MNPIARRPGKRDFLSRPPSKPSMNRFLSDFRYALRGLLREPSFAVVAALTLALGIGATTAMFSVARAVLWRPLPYPNPEALIEIWETNPLIGWTDAQASPANFADWRKRNTVFTGIAAYQGGGWKAETGNNFFLTGRGEPFPIKALRTTGNLFDVLGATPLLGRVFREEETYAGRNRVAILSYGLWQTAFGGDRRIIGRIISINQVPFEVVGVMPETFFFPTGNVQLWIPLGYEPRSFVEQRRPHGLRVIARMKPSITLGIARSQMTAIASQLEREYPDTNTKMGIGIGPLRDWTVGNARSPIVLLMGAVAFLLLIVCANIANLQLSRGVRRTREIGIRTALGASRWQIARQLLTESLAVSVIGGALGLAIAAGLRSVLMKTAAGSLPLLTEVRIDWTVAAFDLAVSLAAPALFGLLPAFSNQRADALADRTHAASGQSRRARNLLVSAEIAFSMMLVTGAGLLVESLLRLEHVDPGFQADRAMTFHLSFSTPRYRQNKAVESALDGLLQGLKSDPRVVEAGAISSLPLEGSSWTGTATIENRPPTPFEHEVWHKAVTPGYFRAAGIQLLRGRLLDEHDAAPNHALVTLINQTFARKWFPTQDPVGKRINFGRPWDKGNPWVVIAGVVADSKQGGLDAAVAPEVYLPFADDVQNNVGIVVRSAADETLIATLIREQVHAFDHDLAATDIRPAAELLSGSTKQERFRTSLLAGFAAMALLLAAIGIYGVVAYLVTQRTREIGIRMALGARHGQLLRMIIGQGMQPVALGVAAGLAGAFVCARWIRTLLFGVEAVNPVIYAGAAAALLCVALCACCVPALRASRVDPAIALRDE
jgi:putative ABC transport system permease protein